MAKTVDKDKLLEGLNLTPEQKAVFDAALADETNLETFSRRFLRRDEGSRLAQDAKAAQAAAEAARIKAEQEYRESEAYKLTLTDWEVSEKAKLAADRQALETERSKFKQVLLNGGIDPASPEGIRLAQENEIRNQPVFDPKTLEGKFLGVDTAREIAKQAIELPLKMPAIMARHQKLYGAADADWNGFQEAAKTNLLSRGIAVEQTAEEFFKFGEKEKELSAQAVEDRIAREVEDKVNERISAMKLPGGSYNPNQPTDKLFTSEFAEQHKDSDSVQDKRALDHFLVANEELRKSGITMEY